MFVELLCFYTPPAVLLITYFWTDNLVPLHCRINCRLLELSSEWQTAWYLTRRQDTWRTRLLVWFPSCLQGLDNHNQQVKG